MHTGSPMREVLEHYRDDIARSAVLDQLGLEPDGFFVVSAHREENVDSADRLRRLLDCLRAVRATWGLPLLVSTHPRTRKRLEALAGDTGPLDGIEFHEPFGLFDYARLQMGARCTLSDSGTISEEATILGFAAVTLRESIERPEALDAGGIIMTGLDPTAVVEAVSMVTAQVAAHGLPCPVDYQVPDTSRRVADFILSTYRQHHAWAGIRR
jgi:UDP-N-acetylglucosamine 2-epimerase (non-hydrolysing)